MKKSDRNLLLAAGVAGAIAYVAFKKKDPNSTVAGFPGVGAVLPTSSWVPEKWRGQPTPAWLDVALWGGAGLLVAPYVGMKKIF